MFCGKEEGKRDIGQAVSSLSASHPHFSDLSLCQPSPAGEKGSHGAQATLPISGQKQVDPSKCVQPLQKLRQSPKVIQALAKGSSQVFLPITHGRSSLSGTKRSRGWWVLKVASASPFHSCSTPPWSRHQQLCCGLRRSWAGGPLSPHFAGEVTWAGQDWIHSTPSPYFVLLDL